MHTGNFKYSWTCTGSGILWKNYKKFSCQWLNSNRCDLKNLILTHTFFQKITKEPDKDCYSKEWTMAKKRMWRNRSKKYNLDQESIRCMKGCTKNPPGTTIKFSRMSPFESHYNLFVWIWRLCLLWNIIFEFSTNL